MSEATSALRLSLSPTLIYRDRVVLVHDRDHAEAEQREQGVARVEIPRAVADVLRGQQDLSHREPVALERDLVLPHEGGLADRGGRLLLGDRAWPLGEREPRHAGGDRARRHQRHFPLVAARGRDLARQPLDAIGIGTDPGRGDEPAPDLHDEPPRVGERAPGVGRRRQLAARSHPLSSSRSAMLRRSSGSPAPVTAEIA
jgi:hypothetical protein